MSAEDLQNIMSVTGRLCINPTDLSSAFPHGGTALGYVRDVMVAPGVVTAMVTAEEFGQTAVEEIYGGERWVLSATLRGWDDDAFSTCFPNVATGSSSGRKHPKGTKTSKRAGTRMSLSAVILCFSPDDLVRHRMLVFYKAIPKLGRTAKLIQKLREEETTGVVFTAIPDGSNDVYDWGLQEDIEGII